MARVIKAGAGQAGARPAHPAARVLAQGDAKKVIEKEVFFARQEAEDIIKRAEDERRRIVAEGKQRAAQAREEAMTLGASQAFADAAQEALSAFRARAERYDEAADDIRILALEIAAKVLGAPPDLARPEVERIVKKGLEQLRARRKVRILVSTNRRSELAYERPNLMKAVDAQPDVLVEEADDVGVGFARVVTEVGGALCAEDAALEALAKAVNVKEAPRARGAEGSARTATSPARRTIGQTAESDLEDRDRSERLLRSESADASVADGDIERDTGAIDELPDAIIEDLDDDDLLTRALPEPLPRPRTDGVARARPIASSTVTSSTGKVIKAGSTAIAAGGQRPIAATRVLALDAREPTARREPARSVDDALERTDRRPTRR
jgi:flagellar biosynthesis/type III secretory pathway protein FliH